MITEQLKELQAAKAHVAELEQTVAAERKQALATLPAQYGFADMTSFIRALRETAGRRRTRITVDQGAEVKRLLAAGQTGVQIAAATGLSQPSIQVTPKASAWSRRGRNSASRPA